MTMVTRCPACGTAFRVQPRDLQAHHGQVRCGRCATVFDGYGALATLPETAVGSPGSPAAGEAATGAGGTPAFNPDVDFAAAPSAGEAPATPMPAKGDFGQALAGDAADIAPSSLSAEIGRTFEPSAPDPGHKHASAAPASGAPVVGAAAAKPAPDTGRRPRRSPLWGIGAFLAMAALAAQAAYFYRDDLAAHFPPARPALEQVCLAVGCTVNRPQRPRAISIEASDMQAVDPANPGLVELTATLRNHAGVDVGYPALDVVITNARDHTLARRIFLPAQYLGTGVDVRAGIAASAEVVVRMQLDLGGLAAAGFRLDLLPAPER